MPHPSVGSKLFLGGPKNFGLDQNFFFFKLVFGLVENDLDQSKLFWTKLKLIYPEKAFHIIHFGFDRLEFPLQFGIGQFI